MGPSTARISRWRKRVGWLWRARWATAGCVGLLGGVAAVRELAVASVLFGVALTWSLFNLAIALVDHHSPRRSARRFRTLFGLQLLTDCVLLALLVRATGGPASPFASFVLPIAVAAVLLLSRRLALTVLASAVVLPVLSLLVPLEVSVLELEQPVLTWIGSLVGGGAAVLVCWSEGPRLRRRRRSASSPRRMRRSSRTLVEQMAVDVATHVRDPLGSVRARAELLKLAAGPNTGARADHDLELLLEGLDGIERALRGILAFLPPSKVGSVLDLGALIQEEWERSPSPAGRLVTAGESTPLRGSHAEMSLAVDLLLRLAREHGAPNDSVRATLRAAPAGGQGVLEVGFRPAAPAHWESARRGMIADSGQTSIILPLTILDRIAANHGGRLDVEASTDRVRLSLILRGFAVTPRPDSPSRAASRSTSE